MSDETCEICGNEFRVAWSDTHGIAKCVHCAAPYQILHRDDEGKLLDKPPECLLKDSGKDIARRYYRETGRRAFPGAFDLGFLGGRRTTYSGSTIEDMEAFENWYQANVEDA